MGVKVAYINNNVYLCTRLSVYCAGSEAINALKKSYLTFSPRRSEPPLLKCVGVQGKQNDTSKETNINNFFI